MKKLLVMAATAILAACAPTEQKEDGTIIGKHELQLESDRMTPEVLWAMGRIGGHQVSPDGQKLLYTVSYYSVEENKSRTVIYLSNADGSEQTLLTTDAKSESEPTFIDGGQRIAFLKGGQLWSMALDGSDRQQLTDGDDLGGYLFSPDEKQVVLVREVPATTSIQPKEEDLPLASGMVIDDLNYKHWDQYITSIPHIFLASFDGKKVGEAKDLLEGEPYECPMLPFGGTEQFCWSPDGKHIAYTCRKKTGVAYATSTDSDIYLYNVEEGTTSNLLKMGENEYSDYYLGKGEDKDCYEADITLEHQAVNADNGLRFTGYDTNPQYSPDGTKLAWLSRERDGYEADLQRICMRDMTTERDNASWISMAFDDEIDEFAWADDNHIYFVGVKQARMGIYCLNVESGEIRHIAGGDFDYTGLNVASNGLYAKRHSLSAPDDIYFIGQHDLLTADEEEVHLADAGFSQPTAVTHENAHLLDQLALGDVKERWVQTTDGKLELCWVIYPPHFDPAKKYPTLLFCEGGPQSPVSQFWSYRWNFQIMAANDYIIIAPNRRGLPGFGKEWLEQISGDYSGQCMRDYLSAIDDLAKEPYVDSDRLGCVGASFGGYSVYWLAGNHEKRFKAFIAHDGIFNTTAQYTETEEMWFENWDAGGAFWRVPQNTYYTQSPHLYIDKWDTPILCIHGEKDYRILSSQGQSAFTAARLRGIPAQLLLYPDENHWVLKPQNGVLWQRTFFRWLDRWLK